MGGNLNKASTHVDKRLCVVVVVVDRVAAAVDIRRCDLDVLTRCRIPRDNVNEWDPIGVA